MRKVYHSKKSISMSVLVGSKSVRLEFSSASSYGGIFTPSTLMVDDEETQKAIESREDFKRGVIWLDKAYETKEQPNEDKFTPPPSSAPQGGADGKNNTGSDPIIVAGVTNAQSAKTYFKEALVGKEEIPLNANNSYLFGIAAKYNIQFPDWGSWVLENEK